MGRVYERKHSNSSGSPICRVTELEEGLYSVEVQGDTPEGKMIELGVWGPPPSQTLVDAKRAADRELRSRGHKCSPLCEKWTDR
jgi:hypothetical protein